MEIEKFSEIDGIGAEELKDMLIPKLGTTLSRETKGYNVYVDLMQHKLNKLGYKDMEGKELKEDGVFGTNTEFAVNTFKETNKLWNHNEYRGKVGQTSYDMLFSGGRWVEPTTTDIIEANLDRWEVEGCFRQSNSTMSVRPIHHWTDSKIRCHLLCCVIALTYLRRLELRMERQGIKRTARDILDDLSHLHSALILDRRSRKPRRVIEKTGKTQEEVLKALGHCIDAHGVLQALK